MTAQAPIKQAPKLFCDDDYKEDVIELYTDNAFFVVEHSTHVEREEGFDDCWSYGTESHYTKGNGCYSYEADTTIKSVKLLIADGIKSECVKAHLPNEFLKQIELFIANMAEQYAKDGDDDDY